MLKFGSLILNSLNYSFGRMSRVHTTDTTAEIKKLITVNIC